MYLYYLFNENIEQCVHCLNSPMLFGENNLTLCTHIVGYSLCFPYITHLTINFYDDFLNSLDLIK